MVARETPVLCARSVLALACYMPLLIAAAPAHVESSAGERDVPPLAHRLLDRVDRLLTPRCLTPAAGRALEDVIAAGALHPLLGSHFTLERADVSASQVEVEIQDQLHHSYAVTLALPGSKGGKADGEGRQFLFYLAASPNSSNSDATTALLAAAALFDQAIPESALGRCGGGSDAPRGKDRRYPRALVLTSATAEVVVLLAAILFGLRAVGSG